MLAKWVHLYEYPFLHLLNGSNNKHFRGCCDDQCPLRGDEHSLGHDEFLAHFYLIKGTAALNPNQKESSIGSSTPNIRYNLE